MMNSEMTLTLPSPAKLNLFLHIVGRKADGYHELQTAFQFLDISDTLTFDLRQDGKICLDTTLKFPVEKNLTWLAATTLQKYSGVPLGATIRLVKKIPLGSGLGGGSSNAATTLLALNHLWKTNIPQDALADLGKKLGADVPVFVKGLASWGEGIGEKLTPANWSERWYVLLIPPCSVSTAEMFAHTRLNRHSPRIELSDFLANPEKTRNDFEPLVRETYPPIDAAFVWLQQFESLKPRLTGSGCAIFAAVNSVAQATEILAQKPPSLQGFIAKSMNRSALHFLLANFLQIR